MKGPSLREDRFLPENWRIAQLHEVCVLNPPRPKLARADDIPTSFIPMSAVSESGRGISVPETRPFYAVKKGYTYFEDGDIIFAKITPCMQNGKHAIVRNLLGGFGFGSTEFHVLRPLPGIECEWIHKFLIQPRVLQDAKAHFTGAVGQQRVPDSYLASLDIPVPPLPEQRRIAAPEETHGRAETHTCPCRNADRCDGRSLCEWDQRVAPSWSDGSRASRPLHRERITPLP